MSILIIQHTRALNSFSIHLKKRPPWTWRIIGLPLCQVATWQAQPTSLAGHGTHASLRGEKSVHTHTHLTQAYHPVRCPGQGPGLNAKSPWLGPGPQKAILWDLQLFDANIDVKNKK